MAPSHCAVACRACTGSGCQCNAVGRACIMSAFDFIIDTYIWPCLKSRKRPPANTCTVGTRLSGPTPGPHGGAFCWGGGGERYPVGRLTRRRCPCGMGGWENGRGGHPLFLPGLLYETLYQFAYNFGLTCPQSPACPVQTPLIRFIVEFVVCPYGHAGSIGVACTRMAYTWCPNSLLHEHFWAGGGLPGGAPHQKVARWSPYPRSPIARPACPARPATKGLPVFQLGPPSPPRGQCPPHQGEQTKRYLDNTKNCHACLLSVHADMAVSLCTELIFFNSPCMLQSAFARCVRCDGNRRAPSCVQPP